MAEDVCRQVPGTDPDTSWRRCTVAGSGRRRARHWARRRTLPGRGRTATRMVMYSSAATRLKQTFHSPAPARVPLVTLHRSCTLIGRKCNELVALASCFPHCGRFSALSATFSSLELLCSSCMIFGCQKIPLSFVVRCIPLALPVR
jgi:hypothetical protein